MLNIKDPETERLVRELAAETGETVTTVVREAVRERLARRRSTIKDAPDVDWAMIRPAQEFLSEGDPSVTSGSDKDLYDENGLPA